MRKVSIGLLGCGNISPAYVAGCRQFDFLDLVACADIVPEKAAALAAETGLRAVSVAALLADPAIELVVNLTIPAAHAAVSQQIIATGKHVYSEKPLAISRADGRAVLDAAAAAGVRVGCAPDTFLGGGLQTSRKLIDDGWIGTPVGAAAFFMSHGPEGWHPNPAFFYEKGAGPLFDVGVYYVTALVHLLGPIRRVAGAARAAFPERVATSEARFGERLPVETPTHVTGVLDFVSGPIGTLITSFDVWASALPRIEVYGSEGTLQAPDPNIFGGPVRVRRAGADAWHEVPLTHSDAVRRGVGVADMAYGLVHGRPHRASGDLGYHVLDVMAACLETAERGAYADLDSIVERPSPLPLGLLAGTLDVG